MRVARADDKGEEGKRGEWRGGRAEDKRTRTGTTNKENKWWRREASEILSEAKESSSPKIAFKTEDLLPPFLHLQPTAATRDEGNDNDANDYYKTILYTRPRPESISWACDVGGQRGSGSELVGGG